MRRLLMHTAVGLCLVPLAGLRRRPARPKRKPRAFAAPSAPTSISCPRRARPPGRRRRKRSSSSSFTSPATLKIRVSPETTPKRSV